MPRVVSIEDFVKIFRNEMLGISFVYNNVAVIRWLDGETAGVIRIEDDNVTRTKVPLETAIEVIRETGVDEVYLIRPISAKQYIDVSFYRRIPVWHDTWSCGSVGIDDVARVALREGIKIFTPVPIAARVCTGVIVAPTRSEVEFILRVAEIVEKALNEDLWAPRRVGDEYIYGYEPIDATPVAEMFRTAIRIIADLQLHEWIKRNAPCLLREIEIGRRSRNTTWIMKTIVKFVYGDEYQALPIRVDARIIDEIASTAFYTFSNSAYDLPLIGEAVLYALANGEIKIPSKIAWRRSVTMV